MLSTVGEGPLGFCSATFNNSFDVIVESFFLASAGVGETDRDELEELRLLGVLERLEELEELDELLRALVGGEFGGEVGLGALGPPILESFGVMSVPREDRPFELTLEEPLELELVDLCRFSLPAPDDR